MAMFLCLVVLGLGIYFYRQFSQLGGSMPLAVSARAPASHWAIPAAFISGLLLQWAGFDLLEYLCGVIFHEVGHSAAAWLAGRWSFPAIIVGFALHDSAHSPLLATLVVCAISALLWFGIKVRSVPQIMFSLGLVAVFIYLNVGPGQTRWEEWVIFGGHAGEFILPALVIGAFYCNGPDRLRWDWFRYPALFIAVWALIHAWFFWRHAALNPIMNIYGGDIADRRFAEQDIARLIHGHKWTAQLAAERYVRLGNVVMAFSALVYGYALFFRKKPESSGPSD